MLKRPFRYALVNILGFILVACGGSGPSQPGGGGNAQTPGVTLGANQGQALLGPIVGATVTVYEAGNFNGTPLCTLSTSSLNVPGGPGVMNLSSCSTVPGKLYFVVVRGGNDIDADDDGFLDSTPTPKLGALRALISGEDISRGEFRINILTEIAYQSVTHALLTGGTTEAIREQLDNVASQLLDGDINSDEVINNTDLVSFSPLLNANAVSGENEELIKKILAAIHSGDRSALTSLSRQLLLASLGEVDYGMFPGIGQNFVPSDILVENGVLYAAGFDPGSIDNDIKILIINIQDFSNPALLGEVVLNSLPADPQNAGIQMIKANGFLYLVSKGVGMVVVNVTNPMAPVPELHFEGEDFHAIAAGGDDNLYVSAFDTDLIERSIIIFDISDPSSPSILATTNDHLAFSMVYDNGHLFTYGSGVSTFDAGSRANLVPLDNISFPGGSGRDMVYRNGFVYVPVSDTLEELQGIAIIDARVPDSLVEMEPASGFFGFVSNLALADNLLFAGNIFDFDSSTLTTFEIQESGALSLLDSRSAPLNFILDSDGGRIYLSGPAGFTAYPVAALHNRSRHFDFLLTPKSASHVEVLGDVAFVADGNDLLSIDVSAPGEGMTIRGDVSLGNRILDMKIDSNHAFLAASTGGMIVVDISDPDHLQIAGFNDQHVPVSCPGGETGCSRDTRTIAVRGDTAYTFAGFFPDNALGKFSIAVPPNPMLTGEAENIGTSLLDIAIKDSYLYGVNGSHLYVYSADNLALSSMQPMLARTIEVVGDYAYTSSGTSGISILNVANSSSPVLFGGRLSLGIGNAVSVAGNTAYVANEFGMIEVYDVSARTDPELLFIKKVNGTVKDVYATEEYIYAVNGFGLLVEHVLKPVDVLE